MNKARHSTRKKGRNPRVEAGTLGGKGKVQTGCRVGANAGDDLT